MHNFLSKKAPEGGTYIITVDFLDEDGGAIAPDTLSWTLTDSNSTVINSRSAVSVSSPEESEDIVLRGSDLALQTGEGDGAVRVVTIEATYDSLSGLDLPLRDSAYFHIQSLRPKV
jgi:hypothetical protein